jgi:glycosyltransferase involved in cell wall biosynthesis
MTHLRAPRFGGQVPDAAHVGRQQADWLVATGDFTPLGGMDRANYALAAYLAGRGDTVHLVAHRVADDLAARRGVVVHHVPRPLGAHLLGAPLLARAAVSRSRALPSGARALMNGGNGVDGAPTWIHYLHAAYTPEVASSLRTRVSASAGRRYYLAREAAALRAAPLVICNSRVTAADLQRHYGVPAAKTAVVYYGIDAAAFGPSGERERLEARAALGIPAERPVAMFIGALGDRRKGFDLLFDAWRSLSAGGGWNAELIVAGAGAEQGAWASRAHAAGLTGVRMLGFRTDVATLLAAADVLVHPARYEAYGLGVHEAICRGVPAIVSAAAGVAERLPADLGPLVLPADAGAGDVAAALVRWQRDAAGWRARVAEVSAAFRARTWDHMAADVAAAVEAA